MVRSMIAAAVGLVYVLGSAAAAPAARKLQGRVRDDDLAQKTRSLPPPGPITSLPGLGKPLGYHESGYISVGPKRNRHLWYYMVKSAGNPVKDPVVLWLNGGPGCSSMDGFIWEHGPFNFKMSEDGASVKLRNNPYSWHKAATMIFLDSPAGVGLSLADDEADLTVNDTRTAADSEHFLRGFFAAHPELAANQFFISGESYAGIYVPMLTRAVVAGNEAGHKPHINLQGYLVGNGCTDEKYDGNAFPPFAVGKSLVPASVYAAAQKECGGKFYNAEEGSTCSQLLASMDEDVSGLNVYDVLEQCWVAQKPSAPSTAAAAQSEAARQRELQALYRKARTGGVPARWPVRGGVAVGEKAENWAHVMARLGAPAANDPPCTNTIEGAVWLNDPDVRAALHAAPVDRQGWVLCTAEISYTHDAGSMIPIHRALTQDKGLRAMIYSGDHDMAVPHTGTEAWTHDLGLRVLDAWRPWLVDGKDGQGQQVAGFTVAYPNLTYASVKGAGHMVPTNKPAQALAMFSRFLKGATL